MIENENTDFLFGVRYGLEAGLQMLNDGGECMFLNQEEQALFRLEVIIKSRERHAAGVGKIAHGRALIAFLAEDFGGMGEDFGETLVKAGAGGGPGAKGETPGCRRTAHKGTYSNVRSNSIIRASDLYHKGGWPLVSNLLQKPFDFIFCLAGERQEG